MYRVCSHLCAVPATDPFLHLEGLDPAPPGLAQDIQVWIFQEKINCYFWCLLFPQHLKPHKCWHLYFLQETQLEVLLRKAKWNMDFIISSQGS